MRRWGLRPSEFETIGADWTAVLRTDPEGRLHESRCHYVQFGTDQTDDRLHLPEVILWRFLSHILIDELPDEGLPELLESLSSLLEFYHEPALETPKLPGKTETILTTVVSERQRPVIVLEEE